MINISQCFAELMILGFISLILVFGQNYIPGICIPSHVANRMLPCPVADEKTGEEEHNRRLLWYEHRVLAARTPLKCKEVSVRFGTGICGMAFY